MSPSSLIHSIYYYVVVFVCVIAIAISSISLLQRTAIDLFFPDLANNSYYYTKPSIGCAEEIQYKYEGFKQDSTTSSSSYQPDNQALITQCEADRKQQEEAQAKQLRIDKQSTYLYSTLSLFVSFVILAIHYVFLRPGKKELNKALLKEVLKKN